MVEVVGLEIFILILLKISVGVVICWVIIIWIVKLICDSLLFEVILESVCIGWFGLVDIKNEIILKFIEFGVLLVVCWILIVNLLFFIDKFVMLLLINWLSVCV